MRWRLCIGCGRRCPSAHYSLPECSLVVYERRKASDGSPGVDLGQRGNMKYKSQRFRTNKIKRKSAGTSTNSHNNHNQQQRPHNPHLLFRLKYISSFHCVRKLNLNPAPPQTKQQQNTQALRTSRQQLTTTHRCSSLRRCLHHHEPSVDRC
jgi:hypothetical protein